MIQKTITYKDFDGNERTEIFRFNLSKVEAAEMDSEVDGGMLEYMRRISAAKSQKAMIEIFKKIILLSYGEKSTDGRQFIKSPELSKAFSQTPAFEELFIELATNHDAAIAFLNGIIPQGIEVKQEEIDAAMNAPVTPNLLGT